MTIRVTIAAALLFATCGMLPAQTGDFSITLTGQSMIRSDIRVHAPAEVPVIQSLLQGDVRFTNFESTIVDEKKGPIPYEWPLPLSARSARRPRNVWVQPARFPTTTPGTSKSRASETFARGRPSISFTQEPANMAEASAPGYLHTRKGTVALVGRASGLMQRARRPPPIGRV